jgi:hypothetical protein
MGGGQGIKQGRAPVAAAVIDEDHLIGLPVPVHDLLDPRKEPPDGALLVVDRNGDGDHALKVSRKPEAPAEVKVGEAPFRR